MRIDIICPLYNAEKYLLALNKSLVMQKDVFINKIMYVLTESKDNTEKILIDNQLNYKKISKKEFSHSIVRENAARDSDADIICFISQDIVIQDEEWLYKLTECIIDREAAASYSRQISKFNNIEKYTREYNYPSISIIKSESDIKKMGLKTFFFSDASSAIKRDVFIKLNGYDHKDLPINEDMYIAYKLITNGYKIKYCADSIVYHSHNFKLKEIYDRYKLTGKFFKENNYLSNYGTNESGAKLAKYVLKRILKDLNILLLFRYPFDMSARLLGMKVGKK